MKVKPRLEARFTWNFAETEYTEEIKDKMDAIASKVAKALGKIAGNPSALDIHWTVEAQMEKLSSLEDLK